MAAMRFLAIVMLVGLWPCGSQAATLHCSFTEPFFVIDFDTATGQVILTSPDEFDENGKLVPRILGENAKLVREQAWREHQTFYLRAGNETILTLKLTGQGSDGMSEAVFPFEATGIGPHAGGCETDRARSFDLYDIYQDFGME